MSATTLPEQPEAKRICRRDTTLKGPLPSNLQVMLLAFSAIFAFIWCVAVARGITFSGFIHFFLVAAVLLVFAHCRLPARRGNVAQSCPDPLHQRRLSRLLTWRPRPRRP